ncbi:MAG: single-stranded DNA-binding protein [Christensenellaceae bacterium]|nr:single-stranded DNA-binding protein [Christensenellaceae bacterium]
MPDTSNSIKLTGRVFGCPEYSHCIYGEAFFKLILSVRRLSGAEDLIPVTVSERLLGGMPVDNGMIFDIDGQIRSYNQRLDSGSRLLITVFAREFIPIAEEDYIEDHNEASLMGYICKPIIYRTTPFSREISDILLAVNRRYGKSDYLPCIAWGRNARFTNELNVGDNVHVIGRLQSREYKKTLPDGTIETRTAYEISCSAVELLH